MFIPSPEIIHLLQVFAPRFTEPAFSKAVRLACGVILSPGRRTVASALRAVGLDQDSAFGKHHRLLSRDRWSALHCSKFLLLLLLSEFIADSDIVELIVDETLERRRGKKITYKGWYRDPVLSTQATSVTSPGVRWLCLCLLVPVPWSKRRWALPFATVPVCSEKNCQERNRTFRGSSNLTVELILKVRQWLGPSRRIRLTGDGGFTSIYVVLHCIAQHIEQVGRLRFDAAFYDDPPEQPVGKRGPKPKKGARQQSLKERLCDPETQWKCVEIQSYGGEKKSVEIASGVALWYVSGNDPARLRWVIVRPQGHSDPNKAAAAFFSSRIDSDPQQIVASYTQRWNIEVFFEEVRACLGFETQRGWCNKTIGRTTPCLFGVFSIIVVLAKRLYPEKLPLHQTAWYEKEDATFRDALSAVREHLWRYNIMVESQNINTRFAKKDDLCLIPRRVFEALQSMACYTL